MAAVAVPECTAPACCQADRTANSRLCVRKPSIRDMATLGRKRSHCVICFGHSVRWAWPTGPPIAGSATGSLGIPLGTALTTIRKVIWDELFRDQK